MFRLRPRYLWGRHAFSTERSQLSALGVLGMGRVGASLTAAALMTRIFKVYVLDVPTRVEEGMNLVEDILKQGKDDVELLQNVSFVEDSRVLARSSPLIIDASEGNAKEASIRALAEHVDDSGGKTTILTTNIGKHSVSGLAAKSGISENVVGLHFFLDPHASTMAEVINGVDTTGVAYYNAITFVGQLKKKYVVSKDTPGFISERLLMPYINEAAQALYEKISTPEEIDLIMSRGTAESMGPLAMADEIGLDRCLDAMQSLLYRFGDSKYRPSPLLLQYVESNCLGKRVGRGFYNYPTGQS